VTTVCDQCEWKTDNRSHTQITDDELTKELVTKGELRATEERLRGEIKSTEEKLRGEIKATEGKLRGEIKATEERLMRAIHKWSADTIKWMFIFWIGQIAALTAIIKLMLKWR